MRPRTDLWLGVGILSIAFGTAIYLRAQRPAVVNTLEPASTFLPGPAGTQGLFDGTRALGIGARRYRGRTTQINKVQDSSRRQLLMLIEPVGYSPAERGALLKYSENGDLLLAGHSTDDLMNCFGYDIGNSDDTSSKVPTSKATLLELLHSDSVQVAAPGSVVTISSPWVSEVLVRHFERTTIDSSHIADAGLLSCTVPAGMTVDTMLVSTRRQPVALMLQRSDGGPKLYLVADASLLRNRALRQTDAGMFALGLVAGKYDEVIFEEAHHGRIAGGSMSATLMAWSRESPWGWLVWQISAVGVLALLFAAIRFGPIRGGIVRTRRSSLEHVNALAVALSAARGHDEAVAAMVRGLRRRLVPSGQRARTDWRLWLAEVSQHPGSPRADALFNELQTLTIPGQPSASVRRAALLVEELWQQLRP